jgi:hypothetical protein
MPANEHPGRFVYERQSTRGPLAAADLWTSRGHPSIRVRQRRAVHKLVLALHWPYQRPSLSERAEDPLDHDLTVGVPSHRGQYPVDRKRAS